MLTGFSCKIGAHIGVWDKPCGPRIANASEQAGRRTPKTQQPFQSKVGGGFIKPDKHASRLLNKVWLFRLCILLYPLYITPS